METLHTLLTKQMRATHPEQPWLRFDHYMQLCLYADEVGYYSRPTTKIGPDGDFYTSSNIGTIMGEMLASWLHAFVTSQLPDHQPIHIVEWGGGSGRLAKQILDELRDTFPQIYGRLTYAFSEISDYHQRLQQEAVSAHVDKLVPHLAGPVKGAYVLVLANELLDAMPCRRLRKSLSGYEELVVVEVDGQFRGEWRVVDSLDLPDAFLGQVQVGQQFEWVAGIAEWFEALDATYAACTVVTIDYGDIEAELLGAHRMEGTFVCYRKHQVSDDPFAHPGEQDMTAHVNFTQVTRVAKQLGWRVEPLRTQKQFLLDTGILKKLQAHGALDPFDPVVKRNRAIRQLLLTDQMSELFKVCIAHK